MKRRNSANEGDTPKWWDDAPSTSITRETEDATADLFIRLKINPKKLKKDQVLFKDLLSYLKPMHRRWSKVS